MLFKRFIFSALLFAIWGQINLFSHPFTNMVVFGDSLSDSGNACNPDDQRSDLCLFYSGLDSGGRFTNGKVWVEHLARKLKLPKIEPSSGGGLNFAYGGATSGWNREDEYHEVLKVGTQIDLFVKSQKPRNKAPADYLYVVWVGGNDFKNKGYPENLLSNVEAHIRALVEAGAHYFLIPNLPNISKTPLVENLVKDPIVFFMDLLDRKNEYKESKAAIMDTVDNVLSVCISNYNSHLKEKLYELERELGITIYHFDAYSAFEGLRNNPKEYGVDANPEDDIIFADDLFVLDGFHPNKQVHKALAQQVFGILTH